MFCACKRPSVQRKPYLLISPQCPSTLTSTGLCQMTRRVTVGWPCSARLNHSKSLTALVSGVLTSCTAFIDGLQSVEHALVVRNGK